MAKKLIRRTTRLSTVINVGAEKEAKDIEIDVDDVIIQMDNLKRQKAILEKREAELKKQLDAYVDSKIAVDAQGNRFYEFIREDGTECAYKREARCKFALNKEKALKFFNSRKDLRSLLSKVLVARTEFDLTEINNLVNTGVLKLSDIQTIYDKTTTYASKIVKLGEEAEEEDAPTHRR